MGADCTRGGMVASRGRIYALITGAVAVGNMLGPVISGQLLEYLGFYAAVATHVVIGCIMLLLVLLLKETWPKEMRPQQKMDLLRKDNTVVILYTFLMEHAGLSGNEEELNLTASGGQKEDDTTLSSVDRQRQKAYVGLLALVFFFYFGDLVGQGAMFVFYAKTAFNMSPKNLGYVPKLCFYFLPFVSIIRHSWFYLLPQLIGPVCRYYESLLGSCKALVTLVLLPVVYRWLKGPPNDFAFCFFGMACNGAYFLILALLPYAPAAWAAIPLTGLGQVRWTVL